MGTTGAAGDMGAKGDMGTAGPGFSTTVLVSPTGTAQQNGTALLAAMSGITDASATKPYMLKLEPGTYDIGSMTLTAKDFVDIEGSGPRTIVQSESAGPTLDLGVANVEVRGLTITNNDLASGGTAATGVSIHGDLAPRITDAYVNVNTQSSAAATGIDITNLAGATLTQVTANVTSTITATNVRALSATGTTRSVVVTNSNFVAKTIGTAGTTSGCNIATYVSFQGSYCRGDAASGTADGVTSNNGSLSFVDSTATGVGATSTKNSLDLASTVGSGSSVRNSLLIGNVAGTTSVNLTVNIANTQIVGNVSKAGAGTVAYTCFANYTNAYVAATCP